MKVAEPMINPELDESSGQSIGPVPDPGKSPMPGHGIVDIEIVHGQSGLVGAWASSPLKLLAPRVRGRSVWVYTSNLGGGYVAGDVTQLQVRVGSGARAFVGTQSSTKIYENRKQLPCRSITTARVGKGGLLVFAPDPVQAFAGACYNQVQDFHLAADSSLILLDGFTSGRFACGERWDFTQYQSRNAIWRETPEFVARSDGAAHSRSHSGALEKLSFLDSLRLDGSAVALTDTHRLGRFNCIALLVLIGPLVRAAATQLLERIAAQPVERRAALVTSASPLRDGALLRVAGEAVGAVGAEVRRHMANLEELLGDDPWEVRR